MNIDNIMSIARNISDLMLMKHSYFTPNRNVSTVMKITPFCRYRHAYRSASEFHLREMRRISALQK